VQLHAVAALRHSFESPFDCGRSAGTVEHFSNPVQDVGVEGHQRARRSSMRLPKGSDVNARSKALNGLGVVLYFEAGSRQRFEKSGQFSYEQRGMCLLRRAKVGLDAEVQLERPH
jgi:hypothetical protein